jgi:hypothetical protein
VRRERRRFPVGATPLQPEATGAAVEVGEIAEAFGMRVANDSASAQPLSRSPEELGITTGIEQHEVDQFRFDGTT